MSTFGKVLYSLRKQKGISQAQLAKYMGISRSAVGMYEQGKREPDFELEEKIADYFNVDLDTLRGKEPATSGKVTLLGLASCGSGASASILTDIDCPSWVSADCAIQCAGNSMESYGIYNGDIIFIKSGPVPDESIGCVRIGNDYYLKVVEYGNNMVALKSDLKTIFINGEQEDAEIVGKAVFQYHAI